LAVDGLALLVTLPQREVAGIALAAGVGVGAPCMSSIFCRVSEPYLLQERTSK
jgi:hypothetical protein